MLRLVVALAIASAASALVPSGQGCLPDGPAADLPFCNTSLPVPVRVADLVSRLVGGVLLYVFFLGCHWRWSRWTPVARPVRALCGWQNLTEKLGILGANATIDMCPLVDSGVPRLGIASYVWLVETNTGVGSACLGPSQCATTFASPAMLAASFNRTAWLAKGQVISTEMRALHNVGGLPWVWACECAWVCPARSTHPR
jgi:hypothetical protein